MKPRYRLFQRNNGIFFIEDRTTRKQESLKTRDKPAAQRIFHARNEAHEYGVLWHLGGSQTDMATLKAEDIDWEQMTLTYARRKTSVPVIISLGAEAAEILSALPKSGDLFPRLAKLHEKHRAKLFRKRCDSVRIVGVSLHSYRYARAERAKVAGYPERFAQEALGHNSVAVHRAYAKRAQLKLPALEA